MKIALTNGSKRRQTNFSLSEETNAQMEEIAAAAGLTKTALLEKWIADCYDEERLASARKHLRLSKRAVQV